VGHKVFGQAQEPGKQQAQACRKKVPLPVAGVVNAHARRSGHSARPVGDKEFG